MKQADFVEIFLFPKNYRVQIIRNEIIEADFNSDFINSFFFSFPVQTRCPKITTTHTNYLSVDYVSAWLCTGALHPI